MKRSELESLGLTKEQIDQIMSINGADIENAKNASAEQIQTLTGQVETLTGQVTKRDADLQDLQTKLTAAQTDAAKLTEVSDQLTSLQNKYQKDTAAYQKQLGEQAYNFALDKHISNVKFSSSAAQKQFRADLAAKHLALENDAILGFDDYVAQYRQTDPGAFAPEEPPAPAGGITAPQGGKGSVSSTDFNFGFTPLHPVNNT